MNIRHTFAIILFILMLPVTLCGVAYYLVVKYFVAGKEIANVCFEAYEEWVDEVW